VNTKFKDLGLITLATIFLTIVVWLPHLLALPNFWGLNFSSGFATIYRNFDGLEYVTIAKSFYKPELIAKIPQSLSANYYAAHFPLYPVFILTLSPFLGFLKSMLFVSLIFTISSAWAFYFLIKDFKLSNHPLFLSILFLILPARWVIVHSVASAEPIFIFFIISSLYFFLRFEKTSNYLDILLSAVFGLGAQLTRPPGILLFIALALYIHHKFFLESKILGFKKAFLKHLKYFPLALIPLGLMGVFYLYSITYGDFWAYFHSGDNIHLTFPPFQVFNKEQFWVGEIWLEDIIYIFILGFLGGILLLKQKLLPLAFFVLTYLSASTLVAHRDIARYTLPIFPFLLIAFEKVLVSREFKIVLIIIALAIYLYSQNFLIENTAPIPNLNLFN